VPNMTKPTTVAAGRTALKQKLTALPEFKPGHEFPFFRRKGNATLDDYVDSFDWQFQQNGTSTDCLGTRHDYALVVPVKKPEAGKTWEQQRLIYHFYPLAGTSHTAFVSDFNDDDPTIFVTV
jgi:hypothetical protein